MTAAKTKLHSGHDNLKHTAYVHKHNNSKRGHQKTH